MNQFDIIKIAKECGVWPEPYSEVPPSKIFRSMILRFADFVEKAEREECAKICDEAHELMNSSFQGAADAIRSRGSE